SPEQVVTALMHWPVAWSQLSTVQRLLSLQSLAGTVSSQRPVEGLQTGASPLHLLVSPWQIVTALMHWPVLVSQLSVVQRLLSLQSLGGTVSSQFPVEGLQTGASPLHLLVSPWQALMLPEQRPLLQASLTVHRFPSSQDAVAKRQSELQQSPSAVFPSSHSSPSSTFPFPQTAPPPQSGAVSSPQSSRQISFRSQIRSPQTLSRQSKGQLEEFS